ncbi:MAG: glycerophosphodiester phosphodiesterase family protein [Elusimicrobiota bacterium]|nr:glycerophosphodiester phosphodiesterase family protein [Elusimicrobiota bacterium]
MYNWLMANKPLILAHRGALLNAPENTMKAFIRAFENEADGIECDIRVTADGEFIVFHDETTERVIGVNWKIKKTKYAQLKHLRVFGKEPIAHADDILNLLVKKNKKICFFELCFDNINDVNRLVEKIQEAGLEKRSYILAFPNKKHFLKRAKEIVPEIGISIMPLLANKIINTAQKANANSICAGWVDWPGAKSLFKMSAKFYNLRKQIQDARDDGIFVSGGVANIPEEIEWFCAQGFEGIWTDDVLKALDIIRGMHV